MKKIVSIILVAVIILSVTAINAVAAEPTIHSYGDADGNGHVNVLDATKIQRFLAKMDELSDFRQELADVDDDGDVSIIDATVIQQFVAKIIPEIPRGTTTVFSDVDIKAVTRSIPDSRAVVGETISFTVHATLNDESDEDNRLSYEYDLKGVTKPKIKHYEKSDRNVFTYTFPSAGTYAIEIKVHDKIYEGTDREYIVYEVAEEYPFDSDFLYVEYDDKRPEYTLNSIPEMPENCAIDYEMVYERSHIYDAYEMNTVREINGIRYYDFACVFDTKEQYDTIFKVDNDVYDDEFFKSNSLVAVVTHLSCHEAIGVIDGVGVLGDTLYLDVEEYVDLPPGMGVSPTEPLCILIAKVSKADVENVTDIDWVK